MRRIESINDIAEGLAFLRTADPRLAPVIDQSGEIPLRRRPPGFSGLCEIIVAQQLSKASADAIFGRVRQRIDLSGPADLLAAADDDLRACGLSAPKIRTLRALSDAVASNAVPIDRLADLPPEEATGCLTAVKGIGPWTAEVFLLFCLGHRDIFPAGDLALQVAVGEAFGLSERPKPRPLYEMAEAWSPWRGVAARLFWAYYRVCRQGRDAMPL